MTVLVVGLGSMGKRRVRCLRALGRNDIIGFDLREDRRNEAAQLYGIRVIADLKEVDLRNVDVLIISTPPDIHEMYLQKALEHRIPAFVEASVVLGNLRQIQQRAIKENILVAPSSTLRFHPAIRDLKELLGRESYGKLVNFSYHSGNYLPDWHPWESVSDFYVSNKPTGGCREIVPFELTWMVDVFGWPTDVKGFFGSTMDVGADIDDTYAVTMKYEGAFGVLMVDVVARAAVRNIIINTEEAQLLWNWEWGEVRVYEAKKQRWVITKQKEYHAHPGYNKNIIEEMYIDELGAFFGELNGGDAYPHTLEDDIGVLELLERIEGTRQ